MPMTEEEISAIAGNYENGRQLAEKYFDFNLDEQTELFREVAKESPHYIMGFVDGLTS